MARSSIIRREARRSLPARPTLWFRILKWAILIVVGVTFWRAPLFWVCLLAALVLSLALHLFWRWKTKGWTQPWGGWSDVETADND